MIPFRILVQGYEIEYYFSLVSVLFTRIEFFIGFVGYHGFKYGYFSEAISHEMVID